MSYEIRVKVVDESQSKTDTQPKSTRKSSVSPSSKPSQVRQVNVSQSLKKAQAEKGEGLGGLLRETLSPAFTAVAVGYKAVEKVGQMAQPLANFYSSYTGDYSAQMQVSNFNTMWKQLSHPVSTGVTYFKNMIMEQQLNKKQALQRELLGEADLGNEGTYNV